MKNKFAESKRDMQRLADTIIAHIDKSMNGEYENVIAQEAKGDQVDIIESKLRFEEEEQVQRGGDEDLLEETQKA